MALHIANVQIDRKWISKIRETFMADVEHYLGKPSVTERALLEKTLESLDEEELASARLHAKGKMSEEVWDICGKVGKTSEMQFKKTCRRLMRHAMRISPLWMTH